MHHLEWPSSSIAPVAATRVSNTNPTSPSAQPVPTEAWTAIGTAAGSTRSPGAVSPSADPDSWSDTARGPDLPAVDWSTRDRSELRLAFAEVIATLGLLLVVFFVVRAGDARTVAFAVGTYIGGAYYFTSSTSFADPAVTISRMFSDTFAGIEPASVPGFIVAQLIAVGIGIPPIRFLTPDAALTDTEDQTLTDVAGRPT